MLPSLKYLIVINSRLSVVSLVINLQVRGAVPTNMHRNFKIRNLKVSPTVLAKQQCFEEFTFCAKFVILQGGC